MVISIIKEHEISDEIKRTNKVWAKVPQDSQNPVPALMTTRLNPHINALMTKLAMNPVAK
jgi:hypothetical protein